VDFTIRLINKYVENLDCFFAILSDGIASDNFMITKSDGLFLPTTLNVQFKNRYPSLGKTFSIAKNLDFYQNKICQLVPSFPDLSSMKINLQKYRVIVIALLLRLVEIIHTRLSEPSLQEWNIHADSVLISTSETVINSNSNQSASGVKNITEISASTFLYLGLDNKNLEKNISSFYKR
jgi:hypothetical protein